MVAGMEESMKRPLEDVSIETSAKRSNTPGGNEPLLKLLVPNYVAGALIGKGGALMTELKEKYGGNIRLSANRDCYPGTVERVATLTGQLSEINEINNYIMDKVEEGTNKQPMDLERRGQVKIVLTNAAAGLLIGRGGLTIKAIQDESQAKISICNIELASVPGERVLTMSGTKEQRIEACRQIIDKISTDSSNMSNTKLKYMNGGIGLKAVQEIGSMHQGMNSFGITAKVEVQLEIPDVFVGAIMGKQGQNIYELSQRSGARFHFSDKNEYAPGTTDRILKITGDMNQAQLAYNIVNEKVQQLEYILQKQQY